MSLLYDEHTDNNYYKKIVKIDNRIKELDLIIAKTREKNAKLFKDILQKFTFVKKRYL